MKTIPRHMKGICFLLLSVLIAPWASAQSSGSISIERSVHYVQTDASTVTLEPTPYSFIFHVRGGSQSTVNWGPAFYKPGSGGVPQTGPSSATNTGTVNFSAAANNGTDYMFVHDFTSDAAMQSVYPIAPTGGGAYGVKFTGSSKPTPDVFTDGLVYAAGTTYPTVTPQITSVNNDAVWSGGKLHLKTSGITTLNFNTFTQYNTTTYGSLIAVGIYDAANGSVLSSASKESYYLPVGDSTEDPDPIVQPAITNVTIDSAWLVPGRNYILELQYTIIAGRPEEANLNSFEFQGVTSYRRVVSVQIAAGSGAMASADFNADGGSDILWRDSASGQVGVWLMNGTTSTGFTSLAFESGGWKIIGTGDFNADGQSDILWRDSGSGQVGVWLMNGTTSTGFTSLAFESGGWQVIGTGDFNADGQSDLVWRNSDSGQVGTWLMNGTTSTGFVSLANESATWKIISIGDFNADGQSDIVWRDSGSSQVGVWLMNGTTSTGFTSLGFEGGTWRLFGTGDFNADGQSDILWRDSASGEVGVWLMNGTTSTGFTSLAFEGGGWKVINN